MLYNISIMKKTNQVQVAYLESEKSRNWMRKNLPKQGQSKFIREAVAKAIELTKVSK